jgi:hypothetical protein
LAAVLENRIKSKHGKKEQDFSLMLCVTTYTFALSKYFILEASQLQGRRSKTPAQFFAKELTCIMRCANRARVSKQKGRLILQRVLALHGKYIRLSCSRLRMHKYSVPSEVDIFKRRIKMQCNIQHDTHAGREPRLQRA